MKISKERKIEEGLLRIKELEVAYLKRKEFDVEKIIQLGVYEPLYVEECGKIKKWDYDRAMYCKIIRDAAEDYGVNVETKADFLCDFVEKILFL